MIGLLDFVMQLCSNPRVRATVVRIFKRDIQADVTAPELVHTADLADEEDKTEDNVRANVATITSFRSVTAGFPDTMYGNATTQTRLQSETADSIAWARYAAPPSAAEDSHPFGDALSRATFEELASPAPLHAALNRARVLQRPVVVVVGRSRRLAVESHHAELRALEVEHGAVRAEVGKTVGDVGKAFVMAGIDANLLVMQASDTQSHSD